MSGKNGPKLHPFYHSHFEVVEKKDDNSNRYRVRCRYCSNSELVHRDNRLLEHISELSKCPDAPEHARMEGLRMLKRKVTGPEEEEGSVEGSQGSRKKHKGQSSTLNAFLEKPIAKETSDDYHRKLLHFIIHANASFNVVEDHYFRQLISALRPMYKVPSRYVLSGTVLSAECARIDLQLMGQLQRRKGMTLLIDGWEDAAKRSLYGSVLTENGKHTIVLGLTELTGQRATADIIIKVCEDSLKKLLVLIEQLSALCTDDPTVMKKVRREFEKKYSQIIAYACFLHQLNTLIGKITSYPLMKEVARKNTRLVSFFNSSHYWGGRLLEIASKEGIKRGLSINTESRWYALVLMFLSIQQYKKPLHTLCSQPDAQKSKDGLSAIPKDIIQLVTRDLHHWDLTEQFLRFCKPLVDAIGNLESRDATLADCMLELLRCAKHINQIEAHYNDDPDFAHHSRITFNACFHAIDTELHWFALYLHPLCRRLAISQTSKSRTFSDAEDTALKLAKKWKWPEKSAIGLLRDLQAYNLAHRPFNGGHKNARAWWEHLPVDESIYPLKSMAINIFALVPHSAEVERLFSSLGGIQGVRRSRLNVQTFEKMGRLRCHLNSLLHEQAAAEGKTLRRTHAHMHTQQSGGINEDLVHTLEENLTTAPALSTVTQGSDLDTSDPDDVSATELDKEFEKLDGMSADELMLNSEGEIDHLRPRDLQIEEVYDMSELDKALEGVKPVIATADHRVHHGGEEGVVSWDKDTLKMMGGLV